MAAAPFPLVVSPDAPPRLAAILSAAIARAGELLQEACMPPIGGADCYLHDADDATATLATTLAQSVRTALHDGRILDRQVNREWPVRVRGCAEVEIRWYAFPHGARVDLAGDVYGDVEIPVDRLGELLAVLDAQHAEFGILTSLRVDAPSITIGGRSYASLAKSFSCFQIGDSGTLDLRVELGDDSNLSHQSMRFPLALARPLAAALRKHVVPLAERWLADVGLMLPTAIAVDSRTGRPIAAGSSGAAARPAARRRKAGPS